MVNEKTYTMPLKRRKQGKTDYRKRLELLKSNSTRLVVRVQAKQVLAQLVEYNSGGDKVLVSANSISLKKKGWKYNTGSAPAAYLTGFMCGLKAKKAGINRAVLDVGLHTPVHGSNIFAVLKGAIDAGIEIPHSEDCFPADDKLNGKIIGEYRKLNDMPKDFDGMKKKIEQEYGK